MSGIYWDGCIDAWDDFQPEDEPIQTTDELLIVTNDVVCWSAPITTDYVDDDQDALTYWGVSTVDEPISLEPFPCGQYICDEGHPYEQAS